MARPEPRTPLPAAVSLVTPGCVKLIWQQSPHPPKIHLENLVPTLDAIVGWSLLTRLQIFLERDNGTPTLFLSPFLSCPWVKPEIFHCPGLSLRHASQRTQSRGTNSRHINTVRQNRVLFLSWWPQPSGVMAEGWLVCLLCPLRVPFLCHLAPSSQAQPPFSRTKRPSV